MSIQSKTKIIRFCKECGKRKFFQRFCIWCMKKTKSHIDVFIRDEVKLRCSTKLRKYKRGVKSLRRFVVEMISGWFPTKGILGKKLPQGVEKLRIIDRERDEYHEVIKKYGTDEIIHECHEPLSQHNKKAKYDETN